MTDNPDDLKAIVERIERLHAERKDLADGIREIFSEAKGKGYDTKVIKHIVALRSKDANEVQEFEAIVDLYKQHLGMR